jgi:hypothetical protein
VARLAELADASARSDAAPLGGFLRVHDCPRDKLDMKTKTQNRLNFIMQKIAKQ